MKRKIISTKKFMLNFSMFLFILAPLSYAQSGSIYNFGIYSADSYHGHRSRSYKYHKYKKWPHRYHRYKKYRYPHRSYYRYKYYFSPHKHFRHKGFSGGYRSFGDPYGHYGRRHQKHSYEYEASYGKGWSYLANGRARAAQKQFAILAKNDPGSGLPKIGYALAKAMRHNRSRAVWAMRRALQYDPRALDRIPSKSGMSRQISELIDHYHRSHNAYDRAGNAFLVASLAYMDSNPKLAREAIEHAIASGDRKKTTLRLKKKITGNYSKR